MSFIRTVITRLSRLLDVNISSPANNDVLSYNSATSKWVNSSGGAGASGRSGYSGTSGYSGATGSAGSAGTSGTSGYSGATGGAGTAGASGTSGYSGYSGASGTSGATGSAGGAGTSGTSGYSGYSGVSGSSGISGLRPCCQSYVVTVTGSLAGDGVYTLTTNGANSWSGVGSGGNTWTIVINAGSWRLSGVDAGDNGVAWTVSATNNGCPPKSGWSGSTGTIALSSCYDGTSGTSGYSGYSGVSGTSGTSGYSGKSGTSGYSGYSGVSGTSGYSGANPGASGTSGYSGYSGVSGTSGYSGYSGVSGTSGYSGYSGVSGTSGTSGYSGANPGASGTSGYSGYSGYSGVSGTSGYSGSSGVSGTSGYSGYSGVSGTSGFSGANPGASGTSGYSGYSGVSGTSGYSGYSGVSGTSGYSGKSGTSGYSGYSGPNQIAISAGTSSGSFSSVVFSNSNALSFGLNGSTITGSIPGSSSLSATGIVSISANGATISIGASFPLQSFYENMQVFEPGSTTLNNSGSSIFVQPFILPYGISASYVRVPVSMSMIQSTAGTPAAGATFSANRGQTDCVVIYSQGTGANSRSLQSVTSGSAGWTFATSVGAGGGASSSQYTVTFANTYPVSGGNASNYTTSYNTSSASIIISSASMTLFTGPRLIDIPLAASLSAGNYWIGFGRSTSTGTQSANISFATNASMGFSTIGVSQSNLSWGVPGAATSASDNQVQPGLGVWTTNSFVLSTGSIALSQVSNVASNPKMYFQMIRQA